MFLKLNAIVSTNDPWATKSSHRHLGHHHATPCLKLMSTRIFKGNLSEGGRFARRGLFKIHFSVGGGKLISTQLYVSHASQVLQLPWRLRVFDTQKKRIPGFSLAHFPKHCWLKGCLLGSRELFKSNLSLTLKSLFLKLFKLQSIPNAKSFTHYTYTCQLNLNAFIKEIMKTFF